MQSEAAQGGFSPLIPMLILSLLIAPVAYLLARDKERNVVIWTILGCIPMVNFISMWFLIGASNLRLERKLDKILKHLQI